MPRSTPRRTAMACTRCRRLKVKCVMQDALSSCTKCTREKRECRYIPVSEQMGIPERIARSKPRRTRRQNGSSPHPIRASSCSSDDSSVVGLALLPLTPPPSMHPTNLEDMHFSPLPIPSCSYQTQRLENATFWTNSYRVPDQHKYDGHESTASDYVQTSSLGMEFPISCPSTCADDFAKFSSGSLHQQSLEHTVPYPRSTFNFEPHLQSQAHQYSQPEWNSMYAPVPHRSNSQPLPFRDQIPPHPQYTAW